MAESCWPADIQIATRPRQKRGSIDLKSAPLRGSERHCMGEAYLRPARHHPKWLNFSGMAEMSHPGLRNFFAPPAFKYIDGIGRASGKAKGGPGAGGGYEIPEIFRATGSPDGVPACTFAGAGWGGNRSECRSWIRGWATRLRVWILRLLSVRLRPLRLLWAELVRQRNFYWRRSVVPRLLGWPRMGSCRILGRRTWILRSRILRSRLGRS